MLFKFTFWTYFFYEIHCFFQIVFAHKEQSKTTSKIFEKNFIFSCVSLNSFDNSCIPVYYHNQASFHLWWKENLVKHKRFSIYYDHGCLQNFLLHFISLLTVLTVKNSRHIFGEIYFTFLKGRPRLESLAKPDLHLKEKIKKVVINK